MHSKIFFTSLLAVLLALCGCSTNPVTGRSELMLLSEEQEVLIGEQNYKFMQQAEGGDYVTDSDVQKYVERVGMRLAKVSDRPHLPYEFVVLNNSIPNAWSLPGGKIAIYRGLLQELNSEAELAAVLGHEIVHSAARHTAQRMQRGMLLETGMIGLSDLFEGHKYEDLLIQGAGIGAGIIFFKYSREDEREADLYGIKYMVAAGYDPQAAVELQRTFVRLANERGGNNDWLSGLFASHPPSTERLENNRIAAATYPPGGMLGTKEYAHAMTRLKKDKPAYDNLDHGYLALVKGNSKEALSLAERGIKIEPKEAHLFNLKGKAELALGQTQDALGSFNRALTLNSNYFDFYLQKGLLEYQLQSLDSAEIDLKKSIDLLPTADAYNVLGNIALKRGRKEEALEYFRIAEASSGSAGISARASAKKLEGTQNAQSKVLVEVELTSTGTLNFYIENLSRQTIQELIIDLTFYDKQHRVHGQQRVRIVDAIPAGEKFFFPSSLHAPSGTFFAEAILLSFN